jgi:hypothetical protein
MKNLILALLRPKNFFFFFFKWAKLFPFLALLRANIFRNLILVQHQYNNGTTTPHMRVGPSMWDSPSCKGLLYSYCIGVVNLTFSIFLREMLFCIFFLIIFCWCGIVNALLHIYIYIFHIKRWINNVTPQRWIRKGQDNEI